MNDEQIGAYAWTLQDEGASNFIDLKYSDRRKLHYDYHLKRKLADKSETIDGKSNPHYPRLRLEADMAQMRFEMSYLVAKNKQLETQISILANMFERMGVLEGAYSALTMGLENVKRLYQDVIQGAKKQ